MGGMSSGRSMRLSSMSVAKGIERRGVKLFKRRGNAIGAYPCLRGALAIGAEQKVGRNPIME
jgi:hypothetical protein